MPDRIRHDKPTSWIATAYGLAMTTKLAKRWRLKRS